MTCDSLFGSLCRIAGENGLSCYLDFSLVRSLLSPIYSACESSKGRPMGPIVLSIQCLPDLLCPSLAHRSLSEEVWMTLRHNCGGKGSL